MPPRKKILLLQSWIKQIDEKVYCIGFYIKPFSDQPFFAESGALFLRQNQNLLDRYSRNGRFNSPKNLVKLCKSKLDAHV